MNAFWSATQSVWEREMGKIVNSHKNSREKLEKVLKTVFETQNTRFSWLIQVTSRQGHPPKHFKPKVLKKLAKCFLPLEISLARESRAKSRKSLCTLRDWTFHLRTSRQNPPVSSRLWHATWMTRDWVAKTGQHCFWIFFFFFFFCENKILSKNT